MFFTIVDYADLASYVRDVETVLGKHDPGRLRETTMEIVRELMEDGLLRPGTPTHGGGFESWPYGPERAARCIDHYWQKLGRAPELGELVWFVTTVEGEELAKHYAPEEDELGLELTE